MRHDPALDPVRRAARPLDDLDDVDGVVRLVGDARLVLLGEATHGTREFYMLRAAITRRLIEHHGFDGVVVEADWPDMLRLHRWVQGGTDDANARQALGDFQRFPRWMWRNREFLRLAQWLRSWNDLQPMHRRAGVYGLDLYSLHASVRAVLDYVQEHEPEMARQARERYGCFDHYLEDPQRYGQAAHYGLSEGCQRQVLQQLQDLMARTGQQRLGGSSEDELFHAQLNALVVRNAERYYRVMFEGSTTSWNQRDRHMHQVLERLREHLTRTRGHPARLVVWAHNSHLGDARATDVSDWGQLNLGQLVREASAPGESFILGFSTDHGSVAAASDWDEPVQFMRVTPARPDSWEGLLHDTGLDLFVLPLRDDQALQTLLAPPRLERAIGVIYRPDTERQSHYFEASLSQQFDAVLHVDRSHALHPLDGAAPPEVLEEPETFPSGL